MFSYKYILLDRVEKQTTFTQQNKKIHRSIKGIIMRVLLYKMPSYMYKWMCYDMNMLVRLLYIRMLLYMCSVWAVLCVAASICAHQCGMCLWECVSAHSFSPARISFEIHISIGRLSLSNVFALSVRLS